MMGPDDDYTLLMEERGDPFRGDAEPCSVCGAASTITLHDEEQSITVCALCGNDQ